MTMNDNIYEYTDFGNGACSISGIKDYEYNIMNIPSSSPNGSVVTTIDHNAFKGNQNIFEVVMPDTITKIGSGAFENCFNLENINFSSRLQSLGRGSFKRCNLQEVYLPETAYIDFAAFSYNSNATIYITKPISVIKSHAFNGCKEIICELEQNQMLSWDVDWNEGLGKADKKRKSVHIEQSSEEAMMIEAEVMPTRTIVSDKLKPYDGKSIFYSKVKKLSFLVKGLHFKNIPVRQSIQLSFYEKYMVLLLQKGIYAVDKKDLIIKTSNFLNVSNKCIEEFVNFLSIKGLISYDPHKNIFSIDESVHFSIDKSLGNSMFADFDIKMADCNKVVFLEEANLLFLAEDFSNNSFELMGRGKIQQPLIEIPQSIVYALKNRQEELRSLFVRYFAGTNMHLTTDISYELSKDNFSDYKIGFDATIEYEYYPEFQKSMRKNTVVMNGNILPDSFINLLSEKYDEDDDLPKFIRLGDTLHNSISQNTESIEKIIEEIDQAKNFVEPIEIEIKEGKSGLLSLQKQHSKRIKLEQEKADELKKEIDRLIEEIKTNESLADASKDADKEYVKNLKNTTSELKKSIQLLEKKLEENELSVSSLKIDFEKEEQELSQKVKFNEAKFQELNETIKGYEKQHNVASTEYHNFISLNEKELNDIVKEVLRKYPEKENILYRYISDICLWVDNAISASEYNSFDEVGRNIDMIREMYRKVLQAVFDSLLKKSAENLGYYLSDPFGLIEIDNLFKKRSIALDIKNKLMVFHSLSNAIGHSIENGPQRAKNEKKVEDFKQMSVGDRTKILLSIPNFFNSIDFTKTEINAIISKLKL